MHIFEMFMHQISNPSDELHVWNLRVVWSVEVKVVVIGGICVASHTAFAISVIAKNQLSIASTSQIVQLGTLCAHYVNSGSDHQTTACLKTNWQ